MKIKVTDSGNWRRPLRLSLLPFDGDVGWVAYDLTAAEAVRFQAALESAITKHFEKKETAPCETPSKP